MKCVAQNDNSSCRRCQRSGIACVFVPRANAANQHEIIVSRDDGDNGFKHDVLRRLNLIENYLGLSATDDIIPQNDIAAVTDNGDIQTSPEPPRFGPLWDAAATLAKSAPSSIPSSIWSRSTIKNLWSWLVFINGLLSLPAG